ncbi:biopolymer transporter ExbD [Litoribacillus peritrichatus]|uniref:Biopolymer transporter ExbD n=1 Tax=Litoribacillus peritrichatus TaxID=718191 RepID=A0ABP7MB33_9GAMM
MELGNALKSRPEFIEPKLEITSMMDMFTIIVFFLLFSYGETPQEVTMKEKVDLPISTADKNYKMTVKMFLTGEKILIEEEPVAQVIDGKIIGFDVENPEQSNLYKMLKEHKAKQVAEVKAKQAASSGGDPAEAEVPIPSEEFSVLLFCDRQVPFSVLQKMMKVTGMAGYPNFQLAVMEKT